MFIIIIIIKAAGVKIIRLSKKRPLLYELWSPKRSREATVKLRQIFFR